MARVKGGMNAKKKHNRVLKMAKGYRGARSKQYRVAKQSVMRALTSSYAGRKQRKRQMRQLWIARINAACRMNGVSYSRFIDGLNKAGVKVNRKMLADVAVVDAAAFTSLVELSKKGLAGEVKPVIVEVKAPLKTTSGKKEAKVETKKEVKAEAKVESVDLDSLTVAELKEMAKAKGIKGISAMKKADLIEALK